MAAESIREVRGLPQGDPWAPLALSALMAPPTRAAEHALEHDGRQVVYLDDRSGMVRDLRTLERILNFWEAFAEGTDLRTNAAKTQ
eukprot:8727677-Alexandrium_andersonii.AAC.1